MDKLSLKKKILEAARLSQREILNTLQGTARERLRNISEGAAEAGEYYESPWEEEMESVDREAHQVDVARAQLDLLEGMRISHVQDFVAPGAVVLTDFRNLFVATSLTDFEVDGERYLGISPESPLYQLLKDKRTGDVFTLKDTNYRIKDIF